MNRRQYLAALGLAVGVAGCTGSGSSRSSPETDGYPPADLFTETPSEPSVDPASFETLDRDGTAVPLVPIDVAYDWYRRRTARFADARSERGYRAAHVTGAVLSSVETSLGPVADWPTDDRIITYCACPHHLSSMRAARLIEAGYENVYALDEGFTEWYDRAYPVTGQQADQRPPVRHIRGRTAPGDAGEDAWARHEPTGQREAAPIAADGSYELAITFVDVTDESTISVETPSYTVEAPLGDLTSERVTDAVADG